MAFSLALSIAVIRAPCSEALASSTALYSCVFKIFGINTAEDLPKIKEVLADQIIEPTVVHASDFEQSEMLAVTDEGELIAAKEPDETEDAAAEEPGLNGHSFDLAEDDPAEDEEAEEANEEFISDELFIEGDEAEEAKEILEEPEQEFSQEEDFTTEDAPDEDAEGDEEKKDGQ